MFNIFTNRPHKARSLVVSATGAALLLTLGSTGAAHAQYSQSSQGGFINLKKAGLQDASGFYMSRRQYQIIDDAPIVRGSNGQIVPASQAAGFGSNIGGRQAPLQRAGFQSYSSNMPQYSNGLPPVNNGVPQQPAIAPGAPGSLTARAKSMGKNSKSKTKTASAPATSKPPANTVSAYNTYKGYNPAAAAPAEQPATAMGGAGGSGTTANTSVRASVLHWNRKRTGQ